MNVKHLELDFGKMFYYLSGTGKTIVFLHGWGQSSDAFKKIIPHFENDYAVLRIDLPGFGMSSDPLYPLSLDDYVEGVRKLFAELKLDNPIIIAHSFGGRIGIRYASKYPLSALILVSSAGIRKRSLFRFLKIYFYKVKKLIFKIISKAKYQKLIKNSGSRDFRLASPVMKWTLSKVIAEDLRRDLKNVNAKTYLFWGIHDQETPYEDAILMKKLLLDAKLIPFYESGHFCYLNEERKFIKTLKNILLEEDLWKHSRT